MRARTFLRRRLDAGDRADGFLVVVILFVKERKPRQIRRGRRGSARHRAAEDARNALDTNQIPDALSLLRRRRDRCHG